MNKKILFEEVKKYAAHQAQINDTPKIDIEAMEQKYTELNAMIRDINATHDGMILLSKSDIHVDEALFHQLLEGNDENDIRVSETPENFHIHLKVGVFEWLCVVPKNVFIFNCES